MDSIEPNPPRTKEASIETLRGLAVLMLVSFHCFDDHDLGWGEFSYGYLGHTFRWLRVPLFTAISGYVFALRPVLPGQLGPFLRGKARRLLLPFLSVSAITVALSAFVGKPAPPYALLRAVVEPLGHLWYLPAIYWVFLVAGTLEVRGVLHSYTRWLGVLALSLLAAVFLRAQRPFAIDGGIMLLPFFLIGLALRRFEATVLTRAHRIAFVLVTSLALTLHQAMWWADLALTEYQYNAAFLLAGVCLQCLLFSVRRPLPGLPALGHYALPIYLYHILAISLGARIARAAHIDDVHAQVLLKLATALAVPVLLVRALAWFPALQLVLLGERYATRSVAARTPVVARA